MLLLFACVDRPDEPFASPAYAPDDALDFFDGDNVRVHFSTAGTNAIAMDDDDEDGQPDLAQDVAEVADRAFELYAEQGFRAPLTESDLGLDALGGSDAMDIYLLELDDEALEVQSDACLDSRCTLHLSLPNVDPRRDLVAMGVFFAVETAYDGKEPAWLLSSAATRMGLWASEASSRAFYTGSSNAFLDRLGCGLDNMDSGDCREGASGAELLWRYLERRFDTGLMVDTWDAAETEDGASAVDAALRDAGSSFAAEWTNFVDWNLRTGPRATVGEGYEFAADLDGVPADAAGATIAVNADFPRFSARYYRVDHGGGPLWLNVEGDGSGLVVQARPVLDGAADGPLGPATGPLAGPADSGLNLGSFDAGGVWVAISNAKADTQVGVCFGSAEVPCRPDCGGGGLGWLLAGGLGLRWRRTRAP